MGRIATGLLACSRSTVPWALALVLAVASLLGCGWVTRLPSSDRYTVTTGLMLGPGQQPLTACRLTLLSLPPPGCGGVEVRGVRADQVPGARRLSNGAITTDPVRLVGRWDGAALNLTEAPRRATQSPTRTTHLPAEATPRALAAQQRVAADWNELKRLGIHVLELSTDRDSVSFLLPVADQRTVGTLEQRYGPVLVSAWLQRI
jgi:hypothetical protein